MSREVSVLMYLLSAPCFPQASIKNRRGQLRSCPTPAHRVRFISDNSGHQMVSSLRYSSSQRGGHESSPSDEMKHLLQAAILLGGRSQIPTFRWLELSGVKRRFNYLSKIQRGLIQVWYLKYSLLVSYIVVAWPSPPHRYPSSKAEQCTVVSGTYRSLSPEDPLYLKK